MCALLVVILSAIRCPLPIANSDSRRVLLGQHGVCLRAEGSELVPPRRRYFVLLCLDPLDRAIVISVGLGRIAAARMTHWTERTNQTRPPRHCFRASFVPASPVPAGSCRGGSRPRPAYCR